MAHVKDTRFRFPRAFSIAGREAESNRTALLSWVGLLVCLGWCVSTAQASPLDHRSVWLLEGGGVAVEMFGCHEFLCGRIVWLKPESIGAGPRVASQQSPLCFQAVMKRLRPVASDRWKDGALYDPRDGRSYSLTLRAQSADVLLARAYIGMPAFGESQVLHRVGDLPQGGWCAPPQPLDSIDTASVTTR